MIENLPVCERDISIGEIEINAFARLADKFKPKISIS
jgi:hypothetical protein